MIEVRFIIVPFTPHTAGGLRDWNFLEKGSENSTESRIKDVYYGLCDV